MKFVKIAGITAVVLIALAVLGVTLVFAQKPSPTDTPWWNTMKSMMQGTAVPGYGNMMGGGATQNGGWQSMQQMHNQMTQNGGATGGGMMGGNGQSMQDMHKQMTESGGMGAMHEWMHQSGGLHDTVWAALAKQLGLTSDELTAQLKNGKTLAQIAQEKGVSTKDLATTMETSMKAGVAQAVKDGKLTQAQADLMLKHMDGQYEWMINNMGAGGMMGSGSGMMENGAGGCHDNNNTQENNTSL